jgi:hypothetical protein
MTEKIRNSHPDALPNAETAKIPTGKFTKYLLDPLHLEGRHKARVFKSVLGFEQSDSAELENAILSELPYHPAVLASEGQWGTKYEVIIPITGVNGATAQVLTVWILRKQVPSPQFVTARVLRERRR